jgi:hypothetical protein
MFTTTSTRAAAKKSANAIRRTGHGTHRATDDSEQHEQGEHDESGSMETHRHLDTSVIP